MLVFFKKVRRIASTYYDDIMEARHAHCLVAEAINNNERHLKHLLICHSNAQHACC